MYKESDTYRVLAIWSLETRKGKSSSPYAAVIRLCCCPVYTHTHTHKSAPSVCVCELFFQFHVCVKERKRKGKKKVTFEQVQQSNAGQHGAVQKVCAQLFFVSSHARADDDGRLGSTLDVDPFLY